LELFAEESPTQFNGDVHSGPAADKRIVVIRQLSSVCAAIHA